MSAMDDMDPEIAALLNETESNLPSAGAGGDDAGDDEGRQDQDRTG